MNGYFVGWGTLALINAALANAGVVNWRAQIDVFKTHLNSLTITPPDQVQ